jgi:hypothetical protein
MVPPMTTGLQDHGPRTGGSAQSDEGDAALLGAGIEHRPHTAVQVAFQKSLNEGEVGAADQLTMCVAS